MAIRRTESGWLADFRVNGRGSRRYRKTFPTKGEAIRYEVHIKNKAIHDKDWNPDRPDDRKLSELVTRWYDLHGRNLKSGDQRLKELLTICKEAGDPLARDFTSKFFIEFRAIKMEGTGKRKGISATTANHFLAYFSAIFNELERMGDWQHGNPLKHVRKLKVDERELAYLTYDQIDSLLNMIKETGRGDAGIISRICLATGARWSEAQSNRSF